MPFRLMRVLINSHARRIILHLRRLGRRINGRCSRFAGTFT